MKGIKCTFVNLFDCIIEDKNLEALIEIPRIQRDYAQGRLEDDVKRIRDKFLDTLFAAVAKGKHIIMDFIYGDIKNGKLIPLDGQQRLTTLFLLHWYIAKKENIDSLKCGFLSRFTYDTRNSSKAFCGKLINFTPDFKKEKISGNIIDQSWYSYDWKNDPTVQAMLVMIDAIHEKFKSENNLWNSLVDKKSVSFYFLPVNEMGDSEELYIKMNSRGKPLTTYEIFKAEFERNIKQIFPRNICLEINKKFDKTWTDMLFPYRGDDGIIDDKFINYFVFISDIIWYQIKDNYTPEKDVFKLIDLLYGKECDKAKENIEYMEKSFDCWCEPINKIDTFFDNCFYKDIYVKNKVRLFQKEINILKECFTDKIFPLTRYLMLYSINTYLLEKNRITESDFIKRIRIVRNLILNTADEIRKENMKTLLLETKSIIINGTILPMESGSPGFSEFQKDEERKKTDWVGKNPESAEILYNLEDHELLQGSIAIVGLENIDNSGKFRLLFEKCSKSFVDRAMLSINDSVQGRNGKFFTGSRNNWDKLFHHSNQRDGFEKVKEALNKLLRSFNEDDDIEGKLSELIKNYLNNKDTKKDWRYYFVKYHEHLNKSGDGYYIMGENNYGYNMVKLNKVMLSGYNWNLYLYLLYKEVKEKVNLDNYYNDNGKLNFNEYSLDCFSDKYVVYKDGKIIHDIPILQENGIDIEDRIEKGKEIIEKLIKNESLN